MPEPLPREPKVKVRRRHRILKFVTSAVLVLGVLAVAGVWLSRSSFLRVQHVTLLGLDHETPAALLTASGLSTHPPMIDVSAASIDQRLSSFVWIKGVTISKHWPNTLIVTVSERSPVAVAFGTKHTLYYVDDQGYELGPAPLHANLPTLQYETPKNSTWPYRHAGRSAAYVASQLPRAFASQVSIITENTAGMVTLKMTTPVTFVLGLPTQLQAKFVSIASVIAHSRLVPGDIVDVSVPGALAVTGGSPS